MSGSRRWTGLAVALCFLSATAASAQGYRIRLDSRYQLVAFRGVTPDSIPADSAVIGSTGGFQTPDGFAVVCTPGSSFCRYFRAGPRLASQPLVNSADITVWGLGITGLSVRGNARWGADLGSDDHWPGTEPALQLLEGYAEYTTSSITGRLGRQHVTGRFGWTGFDGAALSARLPRHGLELSVYGGWGLARSLDVPITTPSLNPLDEFQLPQRHLDRRSGPRLAQPLGRPTRGVSARGRPVGGFLHLGAHRAHRGAPTGRARERHGRHRVRLGAGMVGHLRPLPPVR